jgi:hypothetical protein
MVYHKISPDMKQRALQLIDKGWETVVSQENLDRSHRATNTNDLIEYE